MGHRVHALAAGVVTGASENRLPYHLEILTPAEADIQLAVRWYDRQLPGLGFAFLDELHRQLGRIRLFPHSYPILSEARRRCIMHRFPYIIVYRVREHLVEIVAVADSRSNPASIAGRH